MTELDWNNGGALVADWTPPARPERRTLSGDLVRLEPLTPDHAPGLFAAMDGADANWRFLPYGPFRSASDYRDWVAGSAQGEDPLFFAVCRTSDGAPVGVLSYLRIAPQAGSIEVGHINFSPVLQRTPEATEAIFLTMKWAFGAGYRRFEWKCDAANLASRRAAERYGLSFEGIFRQALVVKGRNRDTAWFAAIDKEWPALRDAYRAWFDPANFDARGDQRQSLADLTRPILVARDPALA